MSDNLIFVKEEYTNFDNLVEVSDNYIVLTNRASVNGSWENPTEINVIYQYLEPSELVIEDTMTFNTSRSFESIETSQDFYDRADCHEILLSGFLISFLCCFIINGITKFVVKGVFLMQIKNIKFNWKTALIIGIIITIFSGCEVKAVNIVNSVPSSDISNVITTSEFNNIIYELYNESIDISTYKDLSTLNLTSTSDFKGIFQVKRRSDGKLFPAVGTFTGKYAKFNCDIDGRYSDKYYFEMEYCYLINTENNSVDRIIAGFEI